MFEVCTGRAIPTAISVLHYAVSIHYFYRLCIEDGKSKQIFFRASIMALLRCVSWREAYGPLTQASDDSFMEIITIELGL